MKKQSECGTHQPYLLQALQTCLHAPMLMAGAPTSDVQGVNSVLRAVRCAVLQSGEGEACYSVQVLQTAERCGEPHLLKGCCRQPNQRHGSQINVMARGAVQV